MLRKFKISIDGKEYLVEMEEIGNSPSQSTSVAPAAVAAPSQPTPAVPELAPQDPPKSESAPQPNQVKTSVDSETLTAPMPGTILKLLVNPGESVIANQPVMILEAMKMENEIVAPKDGTVAEIFVQVGAIVNVGDPLIAFN